MFLIIAYNIHFVKQILKEPYLKHGSLIVRLFGRCIISYISFDLLGAWLTHFTTSNNLNYIVLLLYNIYSFLSSFLNNRFSVLFLLILLYVFSPIFIIVIIEFLGCFSSFAIAIFITISNFSL